MLRGSNIHYEMSDRVKGISCGGVGLFFRLAVHLGLRDEIDARLSLLKRHLPYHESDHVLNIALNILAGGESLEDLEHLRNDENYLNAVGAKRIPDPTTAGDFCRRLFREDVVQLMDIINNARLRVWSRQARSFSQEAILDIDGTYAPTSGECKEGIDISRDGIWGYHPLIISLANTSEVLYLCNRPANRPSHDGCVEWIDRSIDLCRRGGFREVTLRGDTDFSLTANFDRWHENEVKFVFGYDATKNLVALADQLPAHAWRKLERFPRYTVKTESRTRPQNVKERIVSEREFETIRLNGEDVAEFDYSPGKCRRTYRMVVLRKNLSIEKGQELLFRDIRYHFYITNDSIAPSESIVFDANDRCNQENLIEQLKNGVRALHAPVNGLVSNWAYMVMASLAWSLKAWFALLTPVQRRWRKKHLAERDQVLRMKFRTFLNHFVSLPAQIVRQGRRIVYRLMGYNRWLGVFFRVWDELQRPLRC